MPILVSLLVVELAELMYLLLNLTAGLLFWEKNVRMLFGNLVVECSRLVLGPEFSFTMNHRAALVQRFRQVNAMLDALFLRNKLSFA